MKAKFTGHDTFPLRYGWLYKAVNYLNNNNKLVTSNENSTREAIVELGVGKNMVNAIRYWADSSSIIASDGEAASLNGLYLFGNDKTKGKDPYLEQLGSVWLLHFWLNFNTEHLTAYRYFFNYSNVQHFEKTKLLDDCSEGAKVLIKGFISNESTIKKDIDCFLNTYCRKQKTPKKNAGINEDHFSSPLSELNLLQENSGGFYVGNLTARPDLPIEIFIYALIRFVQVETSDSKTNTIDFDALLAKPYSPGRIFRLSENGLGQKLDEAQEFSKGNIAWVDTQGLRQVKIEQSALDNPKGYLDTFYGDQSYD